MTDPREEFRLESEAAEHDARMALLRGRTLTDVAAQLVARGSTVRVVHAAGEVTGRAVARGPDLLVLAVPRGRAAVPLGSVHHVTEVDAPPTATPEPSPGTFRAWLAAHEGRADLEVHLVDGDVLPAGRLDAVAADHLVWTVDNRETYVAHTAIAAVLTPG